MCQRWVCFCGNVGQTGCRLSENYPGIYPQIMIKIINDNQAKWHKPKIYEYTYTTCMQINYPLCEFACCESLDSISVKQILPLHSGAVIHAYRCVPYIHLFFTGPHVQELNMQMYLIQIYLYYTDINYLALHFGINCRNKIYFIEAFVMSISEIYILL